MLKVGLKYYPETLKGADIDSVLKHADFIEVTAVRGSDLKWLKDLDIPFTIHCMHAQFGVNAGNREKLETNRKAVDFAIKAADMLNARFIVVHPGFMETPECSNENAAEFISTIGDKRVVVENLPAFTIHGVEELGKTPEDIGMILSRSGKGMCLDFGHAAAVADLLGTDYMEYIRRFMELKPAYFHMYDRIVGSEKDGHIHLGDGNMDISAIKAMMPGGSWACLEVPLDMEGRIRDIREMRK
jgi:deoxyribonuclease-4